MKNQHEPKKHIHGFHKNHRGVATIWYRNEYFLPCTYCLPVWERMAKRELGLDEEEA